MGHDVRAEVERAAEVRRREGVVDDQRQPGFVGDPGEPFDVKHDKRRIRQRFGEDGPGVRTDRLAYRVGIVVRLDEGEFDPEFGKGVGEQGNRPAVQAGHRDDVISRPGDVQDRQHRRGLSGADRDRGYAVFERRHFFLEGVHGRIRQPGVEKSLGFQVEQIGHALGVVVFVSRALVERQGARFSVFRLVAGLDRLGFDAPVFAHDACPVPYSVMMMIF
ncbi:hypothetical protein SDC9_181070 [bioreactor metagenome]|uniref:Uncharacterized protein n=1 Tax=bioreactor metagenome TaxID=1076179 RepID=A0A645H3G8_9ZZZZ